MNNTRLSGQQQIHLLVEHSHLTPVATSKDFYCAYAGPSMHPTLKSGDLLKASAYDSTLPQVGDVIIFTAPGINSPVVHRIIHCKNGKYRTRGDNCSHIDPWQIEKEMIIGKITRTLRGRRIHNVQEGVSGKFHGFWYRTRNHLLPILSSHLHKAAANLQILKLHEKIITEKVHLRAIRFECNGAPTHRLMYGSKYIGCYDNTASKWQLRLPYRLMLKQSSLPKAEGC